MSDRSVFSCAVFALAGALAVFAFSGLVFIAFYAAPRVVRVGEVMERPDPSELAFNEPDGKQVFCNDAALILRVSSLLLHEQAVMISKEEARRLQPAVSFDFGYKGNTVQIFPDGSAVVFQDKAAIRNRSFLHYLWWRVYGRPREGVWLHYKTAPNPALLEAVLAARSFSRGS
ncbi:MAG: hypothetical protein ACM3X4_03520 [Ignavibacteriales bacterium]